MNKLPEDEVHVWVARIEEFSFANLMVTADRWLTATERGRLQRFYFEEHKKQLLLGRVLMRQVLSRYEEIAPAQWQFYYNEYGKPSLTVELQAELSSPLYFNLSHSQGVLVLAVARLEEIGIDIECNTRSRRVEKIAQRYFSNAEVAEVLALNDSKRLGRFYDLWSLKEAYIKACGMGLAIDLGHFSFSFAQADKINIQFADQRDDDASRWQFWQLNAVEGFNLALAAKSKSGQQITRIRHFDLKI